MYGHCPLQTACWIIFPHTAVYSILVFHIPYQRFLSQAVIPLVRLVHPVGQSPLGCACYLKLALPHCLAFTYTWHVGPSLTMGGHMCYSQGP
jgi:hypothetical protein